MLYFILLIFILFDFIFLIILFLFLIIFRIFLIILSPILAFCILYSFIIFVIILISFLLLLLINFFRVNLFLRLLWFYWSFNTLSNPSPSYGGCFLLYNNITSFNWHLIYHHHSLPQIIVYILLKSINLFVKSLQQFFFELLCSSTIRIALRNFQMIDQFVPLNHTLLVFP